MDCFNKRQFRKHFDLNSLIAYYLITELFATVYQRAKNMFLTFYKEDSSCKWLFIFYDNDTSFGINNGKLILFVFKKLLFESEQGPGVTYTQVYQEEEIRLCKSVFVIYLSCKD